MKKVAAKKFILKEAKIRTPIGIITITASAKLIHSITLQPVDLLFSMSTSVDNKKVSIVKRSFDPLLVKAVTQLTEYFEGKRKRFFLPLDFEQLYLPEEDRPSLFRQQVWRTLCTIPYGQTRSYRAVAEMTGDIKAVRAVGGANNANPFIIVVPCHRVINADATLGGYAGGIMAKKYLLTLEQKGNAILKE